MYAPGVWWTAAHHRIPLLAVMHNNRAYHQELMHLAAMGARHNRGITRAHIGTTIEDPNIDYAKIAQGMGVHAQGPITTPADLGRRSSARSKSSGRASRRSSTSSRSTVRPMMKQYLSLAAGCSRSLRRVRLQRDPRRKQHPLHSSRMCGGNAANGRSCS